jgi:uncharacterized protein YndB with AHSA1/START domain
MLKVIGVIGVLLLVAAAVVLVLAAMKPDEFRVARPTSIKAPPEKIFPLINDLHQFNTWNPFEKKDPGKGTYSGPPAGKGASYAWKSDQLGIGSMTIADTTEPSRVAIKLDFVKPFEAHNNVEFTLVPKGDATEVTWAMNGQTPFLGKIIHVIMDMDKMVGRDFEDGLANMKALAEK